MYKIGRSGADVGHLKSLEMVTFDTALHDFILAFHIHINLPYPSIV